MEKNKYEIRRTSIKENVKLKLWALSAGRCEICNDNLYEDKTYGFEGNFSNIAHIIGVGENGPRARGERVTDLNDFDNLMLLCTTCHHGIDTNVNYFKPGYLVGLKKKHESRIRALTNLAAAKECQMITYLLNADSIAKQYTSPIDMQKAVAQLGLLPKQNGFIDLLEERAIKYSGEPKDIEKEAKDLEDTFKSRVKGDTKDAFAIFAFGCQPLLFKLGTLLSDQRTVLVFQPNRDAKDERWSFPYMMEGDRVNFISTCTQGKGSAVALVLDLSAEIVNERVYKAIGNDAKIYHLTINYPCRTFVRSISIQDDFVAAFRKCVEQIKNDNPGLCTIHIFPAMPISLAVRAGMDRMPKADPNWLIYEQANNDEGFYPALLIER